MSKVIEFIKNNKYFVTLSVALLMVICALLYANYKTSSTNRKLIEDIEYKDSLGNYNKIYYESTFSSLKKENRQLYDSLKKFKNEIDFLIEFTHEKEYNSGKVEIRKDTVYVVKDDTLKPKTYTYTSQKNDTLDYTLKINSVVEPNWYQLMAKVKNKYTIVDKQDEESGTSVVVVKPNNGGNVSDVTVFNKKEKRKLKDRVAIGPAVAVGYDPFHKDLSLTIGVAVTLDLKK